MGLAWRKEEAEVAALDTQTEIASN